MVVGDVELAVAEGEDGVGGVQEGVGEGLGEGGGAGGWIDGEKEEM